MIIEAPAFHAPGLSHSQNPVHITSPSKAEPHLEQPSFITMTTTNYSNMMSTTMLGTLSLFTAVTVSITSRIIVVVLTVIIILKGASRASNAQTSGDPPIRGTLAPASQGFKQHPSKVPLHIYIYIIQIYIYIYIHMKVNPHICIFVCAFTCLSLCIHTYIYIYICMYPGVLGQV